MRRLLLSLAIAALVACAGFVAAPEPEAQAIGAGDVVGVFRLKLKGSGFDRNADNGRVDQRNVRGNATLVISRANAAADPRLVRVEIRLDKNLNSSVIARATPTPALGGIGILVEDSLTVIGAGQANFVNAVTLRFAKQGRRVEGWWLGSFPGTDVDAGFVAGFGASFKGKRLRGVTADTLSAFAR